MFRKIAALIALLFVITACGTSSSETLSQETKPAASKTVDLTGKWTHLEESSGFQMDATIAGETVRIDWIAEDTRALYWVGTLPGATTATDGDILTSVADQATLSKSILGSSDATKDFKYEDGKLSYDFTISGITETLYLER